MKLKNGVEIMDSVTDQHDHELKLSAVAAATVSTFWEWEWMRMQKFLFYSRRLSVFLYYNICCLSPQIHPIHNRVPLNHYVLLLWRVKFYIYQEFVQLFVSAERCSIADEWHVETEHDNDELKWSK